MAKLGHVFGAEARKHMSEAHMQDPYVRFEKLYVSEPNSGCWLWLGNTNQRTGYCSFWLNGESVLAHRASYELFKGVVRDGDCVCHSCDVRSCVNPDHLFLGTYKENEQDKIKKDRRNNPMLGHKKLSVEEVQAIRDDARPQATIADEYGINQSNVSRIKSRERRFHVR